MILINNRIQKIKNYFNNSPKRIGVIVLGIHIFFLLFALSFILEKSGDFFGLSGFMVEAFPVLLFAQLQNVIPYLFDIIPIFVFSLLYYSLFFILLGFAQNTNTKRFKIVFLVFSVWFLLNLLFGLFVLLFLIPQGTF